MSNPAKPLRSRSYRSGFDLGAASLETAKVEEVEPAVQKLIQRRKEEELKLFKSFFDSSVAQVGGLVNCAEITDETELSGEWQLTIIVSMSNGVPANVRSQKETELIAALQKFKSSRWVAPLKRISVSKAAENALTVFLPMPSAVMIAALTITRMDFLGNAAYLFLCVVLLIMLWWFTKNYVLDHH